MAKEAIRATPLFSEKVVRTDGGIIEMVVWRLPRATAEWPRGFKYRLYFGRRGECLVRYDNESGKGDHRHVGGREETYRFVSVAKLRRDFEADVQRYGAEHEEED